MEEEMTVGGGGVVKMGEEGGCGGGQFVSEFKKSEMILFLTVSRLYNMEQLQYHRHYIVIPFFVHRRSF